MKEAFAKAVYKVGVKRTKETNRTFVSYRSSKREEKILFYFSLSWRNVAAKCGKHCIAQIKSKGDRDRLIGLSNCRYRANLALCFF